MRTIISLLFLTVFVFAMSAKEVAAPEAKASAASEVVSTVKLSGIVIDKDSKESLAGAVITVNGKKIYSDLDGKFSIPTNGSNVMNVKVSLISYQDKSIELNTSTASSLKIELNQR